MKVKTSELIGPLLDWAAAKAMASQGPGWQVSIYGVASVRLQAPTGGVIAPFMPGHDWNHCGWLIEEFHISLRPIVKPGHELHGQCLAAIDHGNTDTMVRWVKREDFARHYHAGPTPQIAVTRCFVASVLGDEVDIPGELIFT